MDFTQHMTVVMGADHITDVTGFNFFTIDNNWDFHLVCHLPSKRCGQFPTFRTARCIHLDRFVIGFGDGKYAVCHLINPFF